MLRLDGGKNYKPKPGDEVRCDLHNVTVRWGDLDAIQQLAVSEGLDTDHRCILLKGDCDGQ